MDNISSPSVTDEAIIENDDIIEYQNLTKNFPGVCALNDVSFTIKRGEIHAIVGENGAGKSTLMKVTLGLYQPDSGQIVINGRPVHITGARQAMNLGVSMVPQEVNLVPELTVAENIMLGIEPRHPMGVIKKRALVSSAEKTLESLHVYIDPDQKIKLLSVAEQQVVQIARGIAFNCSILLLDEPTASLSEKEKTALFSLLRLLKSKGTTIIYISHRMAEIFEIADRITVMRDGEVTGTLPTKETNQNAILKLMIGREVKEFFHHRQKNIQSQDIILQLRNLRMEGLFKNISFHLRRGEILGFAGLVGSHRTEVMSAIIGNPPPQEGEIILDGKLVRISSPEAAIRLGIGYVSEERKKSGIFPIMSVLNNITIPFLKMLLNYIVIDNKKENRAGEDLITKLNIRTPSVDQKMVNLSGGNQQKAILSRWLGSQSKILILDEPTRGIDVNAKAEIHSLISNLSEQGLSIIVVSSEVQELLAIADRILIMKEGEIVGEVDPEFVTEEDVVRISMFGED
jgi:inositol transport system ATP-binding protein